MIFKTQKITKPQEQSVLKIIVSFLSLGMKLPLRILEEKVVIGCTTFIEFNQNRPMMQNGDS